MSYKGWGKLRIGWASLVVGVVALVVTEQLLAPRREVDRNALLTGHRFPVLALAFSPDGSTLTSAAGFPSNPREEIEVMVWDATRNSPLQSRTGFEKNLATLALTPDASILATGSLTGRLSWWEIGASHGTESSLDCSAPLSGLAFSASGALLASATRNNELMLCDRSGKQLWVSPAGHDRFAEALVFSPDGQFLLSGGTDGALRVWDVASGKSLRTIAGHSTPVLAAAFSPVDHTLATGDFSGIVKIWDLSAGRETAGLAPSEPKPVSSTSPEKACAVAFSPDGLFLALARGPNVQLWKTGRWQLASELSSHNGKIYSIAFSPDAKLLAAGCQNGQIRVWDLTRTSASSP